MMIANYIEVVLFSSTSFLMKCSNCELRVIVVTITGICIL